MIYVTVGNHDQPFDRLLKAMDELAGALGAETVMQTGATSFVPRHAKAEAFFPFGEAEEFFKTADAVVGHAGIGTVISARKWKAPLVVCPRRREFSEHLNDHQLEICRELLDKKRPGIEVALQPEEIGDRLKALLEAGRTAAEEEYPDPSAGLKKAIADYLQGV